MKVFKVLVAVGLFVCLALPSMAKTNKVNVSGDLAKDNALVIDVSWTVDSAKYPGVAREDVREKVQDEIWNQMLPKIIDATKGIPVSFDKSNFTVLKEHNDLIQERANGSKVYLVTLQVKFKASTLPPSAGVEQPAPPKAKADPKYYTSLHQRWDDEM